MILFLDCRNQSHFYCKDAYTFDFIFVFETIYNVNEIRNQTMIIISIAFLVSIAHTLYIDPLNTSCIDSSFTQTVFNGQFNLSLSKFKLPPFSQSIIEIDLRHLSQIPMINEDKLFLLKIGFTIDETTPMQVITLNDLKIGVNKYSLEVTKKIGIEIVFQIPEEEYKYLLMGSVSVEINLENKRIPDSDQSFLFIVNRADEINLPKNKPDLQGFQGYFLQRINDTLSSAKLLSTTSSSNYWKAQQHFVVPYIPYVSNCLGQGANIYLSQLMQDNESCNLIPIADTEPTNPFSFGSSPVADTCDFNKKCIYDQSANTKYELPIWQTLPASTTLFQITSNPLSYSQYNVEGTAIQDQQFVDCEITSSKGSNYTGNFPLRVNMKLNYYQVTETQKRMISCTLEYSLYVPSTDNFQYQLQITVSPMNHTNILLFFGFQWYVYMIVFIMIGILSSCQNFALWFYHYLVAKQRKCFRVKIYLRVIIKQIFIGTLAGLILFGAIIFIVSITMNGKIFKIPLYSIQNTDTTTPRVFWDSLAPADPLNYDSDSAVNLRSGRMGLAFMVVGTYIIFRYSHCFVGCDKKKQDNEEYEVLGRKFDPLEWSKGKFLFGTFFYITLQLIFIYFAYSTLFSQNIWIFILCMKVLHIIMQQIAKVVFQDILPCLPLKVITDITAFMNTLSANDFYDFLFSFLIDVAVNMIQKAYVSQLQNMVVQKIQQKVEQLSKFYENMINDTEQEIQDKQEDEDKSIQENQYVIIYRDADEVNFFEEDIHEEYYDEKQLTTKLNKVNKDELADNSILYLQSLPKIQKDSQEILLKAKLYSYLQNQTKTVSKENNSQTQSKKSQKDNELQQNNAIFQMLIDVFIMLFTFFIQPFVVLIFWITFDESSILQNYGITSSTVILYLLNALVIGAFTILNAILIFHLLQCYLSIDFQRIIAELLNRFQKRQSFWKAYDADINQKIGPALKGADHYCLSSQFFFIMAVYIGGMLLVLLGISILINVNYNPFQDLGSFIIILFWIVILQICIFLSQYLAKLFNIWGYREFEQGNRQDINENISDELQKVKSQGSISNISKFVRQDPSAHELIDLPFMMESQDQAKSIFMKSSVQSKNFQTIQKPIDEQFEEQKTNLKQIKHKKNKKQFQIPKIENFEQKDEVITAQTKLQTICKKLEPTFQSYKFRMEYSSQNKTYIKNNLEKILPLVKDLPDLMEYNFHISKKKIDDQFNFENKNLQPLTNEILIKWLQQMQENRRKRQLEGLDMEKNLKRCQFCYKTWSIYYGYGGICFDCSKKLYKTKQKQQ